MKQTNSYKLNIQKLFLLRTVLRHRLLYIPETIIWLVRWYLRQMEENNYLYYAKILYFVTLHYYIKYCDFDFNCRLDKKVEAIITDIKTNNEIHYFFSSRFRWTCFLLDLNFKIYGLKKFQKSPGFNNSFCSNIITKENRRSAYDDNCKKFDKMSSFIVNKQTDFVFWTYACCSMLVFINRKFEACSILNGLIISGNRSKSETKFKKRF